jgi:cardiolipin synthase
VVVVAAEAGLRTVALVNAARRSVSLEMYELGGAAVVAALEAARRRGVDVRVLLDATESQSQASARSLSRAGVTVRTIRVPGGIDHVKLLVVDQATVLTGGVNDGAYSDDTTDVDIELTGEPALDATAIFDRDWAAAGGAGQLASGYDGPFVTGAAIEPALLGVIDQARGSCTVLANYLSDWTIRDALVAAARRGVRVEVDLNGSSYGARTAVAALRGGGVLVELAPASPYLHAKVVVCGSVAIVGSANFSEDAMAVNHELDVVLAGPAAAAVRADARGIAAAG